MSNPLTMLHNVLPPLIANNVTYRRATYAELTSKPVGRHSERDMLSTNLANDLAGEFSAGPLFAMPGTPLRRHISHVVSRRSDKEVCWITACRVIAMVADTCTYRDRAVRYQPCGTVREPFAPRNGLAHDAITMFIKQSRVNPAPSAFIDTSPQFVCKRRALFHRGNIHFSGHNFNHFREAD